MKKPRQSVRLFARATRVTPGGVNSPVRAFKAVGGSPLFIARAAGARIIDVDGNSYIDYVGSWGPLIHGHAPRGLVTRLSRQAARGTSFGAPSALEVELAEQVRQRVPSMERVRFVSSGTEATMSAARVARGATGRDKIIKFEGCYHGHADAFLVQAGSGALTFGTPTSPGVPAGAVADTLLARFNDLDSVERLVAANPGRIAGLIVEPVPGNMGTVLPEPGFLAGLRRAVRRRRHHPDLRRGHDRLSPRTRRRAGFYGVRPDLTCLGKIVGGGLPVGAYGGRADLMDLVSPAGPVYQAGTLSGNPLAMTAGLWSLERLTPGALSSPERPWIQPSPPDSPTRRATPASRCRSTRSARWSRHSSPPRASPTSSRRSPRTRPRSASFFRAMLAEGIYLPPSQFEAWFVSGAHAARDVVRTIAAARVALRAVRRKATTRA